MIEISRGYIPGLILKFKIGRHCILAPALTILIQPSPLSSVCIFIDCRTGDISNFFKMLHNLLESLIIKWNLFILSSREQNFNQHLGISFSKENSCSKKLELTICAISGWLVVVWSLAVVYLKMLEGCWLLPDLRHLVSSLESSDPPLQTQIVHISLY